MNRLLVAAFSLSYLGASAACAETTGPEGSVAGTYTLRTVSGRTPPVTLCDQVSCFTVLGGQLQLESNGNFVNVLQLQDPGSPARLRTTSGYWLLSGNEISLVDDINRVTLSGTVGDGAVMIIDKSTGTSVALGYTR